MAESTKPSKALTSPGYLLPFIILTALFFIFGFITNLNMGLVPELKKIFEIQGLATWQAMLANFAFFTAYFVFSTPASRLIEAIGYKRTMVVSLFVQVAGAAMFLPAAKLVSFPLFLAAIFVVGAGVATLQTAANPYVAILGPEESSPIRLTLAQAANSLGGTFAPWIAGTFILAGAVLEPAKVALESPAVQHADQVLIANTVRMPYAIIAVALVILGIAVAFMRLPHIDQPPSSHVGEARWRAVACGATGTRCWALWEFSSMSASKLGWPPPWFFISATPYTGVLMSCQFRRRKSWCCFTGWAP